MKDSGVRSMLKQTLSTVDFHEVCERTLNVTAPLYHAADTCVKLPYTLDTIVWLSTTFASESDPALKCPAGSDGPTGVERMASGT